MTLFPRDETQVAPSRLGPLALLAIPGLLLLGEPLHSAGLVLPSQVAAIQSVNDAGSVRDASLGGAEQTREFALAAPWTGDASPVRIPFSFVENCGQWDVPARFVARRPGMLARFENQGIVLQLERTAGEAEVKASGVALRMQFEGCSEQVKLQGLDLASGSRNYFRGNDRSRWKTGVPQYSQLLYQGLYEGVDLRVREAGGTLEYDLVLAPGARLAPVVFRCEGATELRLDEDGSLLIETGLGALRQPVPKTWYEGSSGERQPVPCCYRLIGTDRYGFQIADRDRDRALVIDPTLEWSTFLGGSGGDTVWAIAVDETTGVITAAGSTRSFEFPTTPGAFQPAFAGTSNWDGFIAQFDPARPPTQQLLWSTYLGGSDQDLIFDVTVDGTGVVTVGGYTESTNFPTSNPFQSNSGGPLADGFVARLDPSQVGQQQLIWSTYLGGGSTDWVAAIDTDGGVVTVGGYADSFNFPTTPAAFDPTSNGNRDAFVTRLDPSAAGSAQMVWSTFLGGSNSEGQFGTTFVGDDLINMGLHVDQSGEVTVAGMTNSTDFPTTAGAYDTTANGGYDVFVSRLDATGQSMLWSTYLGGAAMDKLYSLAVEPSGRAIVAGWTASPNLPTTLGAFNETWGGPAPWYDGFITQLDPALSGPDQLAYSSFFGGAQSWDGIVDVAVNSSGEIALCGYTNSSDLPITPGAHQPNFVMGNECFLSILSPAGSGGSDLVYSTYLGDTGIDDFLAVAFLGDDVVITAGFTTSVNFPTTGNAYDSTYSGAVDGSISRFSFAERFKRGDCNADDANDIADAVFLLTFLFSNGPAGPCADACDGNNDGSLDVADPVAILSSQFGSSPIPLPAPYPQCGTDITVGGLNCASYGHCP